MSYKNARVAVGNDLPVSFVNADGRSVWYTKADLYHDAKATAIASGMVPSDDRRDTTQLRLSYISNKVSSLPLHIKAVGIPLFLEDAPDIAWRNRIVEERNAEHHRDPEGFEYQGEDGIGHGEHVYPPRDPIRVYRWKETASPLVVHDLSLRLNEIANEVHQLAHR